MNETVTLEGVTKKGRERIKRFGRVWIVTSKSNTRLWLKSLCGKDFRYIDLPHDADFKIIPALADQSS